MTTRNTGLRSLATLLICRFRVSFKSTTSALGYQHISGATSMPNFGYGVGSSVHQWRNISSGNSKKPPEPKMVKWVLGSILPLLFSFWNEKWGNVLKLERKVEKVVQEAEEVAEVVEKIASTTENLSAKVAEKLDNGELKEAALMVEHVSSVTAKDARITQDFIHKVGNLKQDLTNLETMVEPAIDKIQHIK